MWLKLLFLSCVVAAFNVRTNAEQAALSDGVLGQLDGEDEKQLKNRGLKGLETSAVLSDGQEDAVDDNHVKEKTFHSPQSEHLTLQAVQCPARAAPGNGAVSATGPISYPNSVTFTCYTGYTLIGVATPTCQTDGTWSHPVPTCQALAVLSDGQEDAVDDNHVKEKTFHSPQSEHLTLQASVVLSDGQEDAVDDNHVKEKTFHSPQSEHPTLQALAVLSDGQEDAVDDNHVKQKTFHLPQSEHPTEVNLLEVDIDGSWSSWSTWTDCIASGPTGFTSRTRHRTCTNPAPTNGGAKCKGPAQDIDRHCYVSLEQRFPQLDEGITPHQYAQEKKVSPEHDTIEQQWSRCPSPVIQG
ncbi:PREDICTED: uncharacterized protein LOC109462706 [Branchiostoma belcheri]|uniref:Uncharacterized protein LOC109462706 n=1 Tax=Branchiostoma belcheri TaxID=7741 RepID=A0A6P4XRV7_BRABE|nr:PREDICTED: uncharacterized protein LOC109462706 [Branchiostoma belcheri]